MRIDLQGPENTGVSIISRKPFLFPLDRLFAAAGFATIYAESLVPVTPPACVLYPVKGHTLMLYSPGWRSATCP